MEVELKNSEAFFVRTATEADRAALRDLIEASVRVLSEGDYSNAEMDGALHTVLGVDSQLIKDGTYFVWEAEVAGQRRLAGSGGWSYRKTLCGADNAPGRNAEALDPATEAAKIRAIFVHPDFARQGLGSAILEHMERCAREAGFRRFEMGATLTGYPLYLRRGYHETKRSEFPMANGEQLAIVHMVKECDEELKSM